MQCGTCVERGNAGAPCTTSNDCDGNLVCTAAVCTVPVPLGFACSATLPCESGMVCLSSKCIQPGGVGASCDADAGGVDCDYNLGGVLQRHDVRGHHRGNERKPVRGLVPAGCLLCRRRLPGRLLRDPARRRLSVRRRRGCELHDPVHMQLRHVQHPERQSVSLTQTISSKVISGGLRPGRTDRQGWTDNRSAPRHLGADMIVTGAYGEFGETVQKTFVASTAIPNTEVCAEAMVIGLPPPSGTLMTVPG